MINTSFILPFIFSSISGISETSPLHQYNLTGDVGDDEVFMVRVLINEWLELNRKTNFVIMEV